MPRPRGAHRCTSPRRRAIRTRSALLDSGANANAREARMGTDPVDLRGGVRSCRRRSGCCSSAARIRRSTPTVLNLTEETAREQAATEAERSTHLLRAEGTSRLDQRRRRRPRLPPRRRSTRTAAGFGGFGGGQQRGGRGGPQPKGPFTPAQIQAGDRSRDVWFSNSAQAAKGPATEVVDTLNGGVAGFQSAVGGMGGLSALHHAVRQGSVNAVMALLDGGANINDTSNVDRTTPLLMATINGQFDVALQLIARGANPNIASTRWHDAALRDGQRAVGAEVAVSAATGGAEPARAVHRRDGGAAQEGRQSEHTDRDSSRGTSRSTTAVTPIADSRTSRARPRSGAPRTRSTSTRCAFWRSTAPT